MDGLTPRERTWAEGTRDFWRNRAACAKQQATRPQTIGYALDPELRVDVPSAITI